MLDPKLIKEKPEMIRNMLKSRAVEFDLDELIKTDEKNKDQVKAVLKKKEKPSGNKNFRKKESKRRCIINFSRNEKYFK